VRSKITTKIIAAVAATLVAELTDKMLDSLGLSEQDAKLLREVIKAVAVVIATLLIDSILSVDPARK
jgi:hypothetical protein